MSNAVGNLAVILSGNAAPLNATLTKAKGDIRAFSGSVNSMGGKGGGLLSGILGGTVGGSGGGMFGALGGVIGGLVAGPVGGLIGSLGGAGIGKALGIAEQAVSGLTHALASAGRFAVTTAADYEVMNVQFGVMTGSAERGTQLLEDMQKLAVATPFKSEDLTKGAQMLMGMGVGVEDILPTMKALGDLAAGDGEKLKRLALAYGQVQAKGRIQGDELRQFTEAGVGVADFAKAAGMSMSEFRVKMEQGAIGADVAAKALNMLTGAGGRFEGMNAKVNQTVSGQWNSLVEQVTMSAQKIGLSLFKTFDVAGVLGKVSDFLAPLKDLGGVLEYPLSQIRAIGGDIWAFLVAGWDAAQSAARNFGGVLTELTPSWQQIRDAMRVGLETLVTGLGNVADAAVKLGGVFAENLLMPLAEGIAAATMGLKAMLPAAGFAADPLGLLGVKTAANRIADGLDPAGFLARMGRVKTAMMEAAEHTNIANTFAQSFRKNLEGGAKAAGDASGFLQGIGPITPKAIIPPEVEQFALKLKGEATNGTSPLEKFTREMGLLRQAEGFGLLTPQIANRGMSSAFDDLAKHFGKALETALPKAVAYGSQEAASVISHALNRDTSDPQQRIAAILQQAYQAQTRTERHTADTARALRNLALGAKGF